MSSWILRALACVWLAAPVAVLAADPTQPPRRLPAADAQAEAAVPLKLQAVLRSAAAPRAVINGQSLHVGQTLAGARLLAIYPSAVLIERQGQRELLRLASPIIKPSRNTP
ncbi:Type II secretory pathway component [Stutzerimonas azotifigens]|uniref:Type II secretory pathway component n=1 Tax=Stutzerimonas azotifigens TaxID=291995 RepID=UPI0004236531|nr:Type II secretory pathway component [Stutzerimonas azotifigens]